MKRHEKRLGWQVDKILTVQGGVFAMETINMFEVERKIGYWQHVLSNIERRMLKMQSERIDVKQRLLHLQILQTQEELVV